MSHYRVLLNGRNFWLQDQEGPQRVGFMTARFVEAANPTEAEHLAIDLLRAEGKLEPLNDHGDPPRIFVDEMDEVDRADVPAIVHGFIFFADERDADA